MSASQGTSSNGRAVASNAPCWSAVGASVRGASHEQNGAPNQDRMLCWPPLEAEGAHHLVAAVADGHGSSPHPRSREGAGFAVETAVAAIGAFLSEHAEDHDLIRVRRIAARDLPGAIMRRWRTEVDGHFSQNPLPGALDRGEAPSARAVASETSSGSSVADAPEGTPTAPGVDPEMLAVRDGGEAPPGAASGGGAAPAASPASRERPPQPHDDALKGLRPSGSHYILYGTTLIAVGICQRFLLLVQNGDGAIVTVSASGEVKLPMPEDKRLFDNMTTSLCLPTAEGDFRVEVLEIKGGSEISEGPELLLLTTDGYPNSFVSDREFQRAAGGYLPLVRQHGLRRIGRELPRWLEEASSQGSRDDATLVLVGRTEARDGRAPKEPGRRAGSDVPAGAERTSSAGQDLAERVARTEGRLNRLVRMLESEVAWVAAMGARLEKQQRRSERLAWTAIALMPLVALLLVAVLLGSVLIMDEMPSRLQARSWQPQVLASGPILEGSPFEMLGWGGARTAAILGGKVRRGP